MKSLTDAVLASLRSGPVEPGDTLVVALSGGLDSVVLLHLLRFPLGDRGMPVRAVHVDHGMRPGSAADALWLRGLCAAWGVPLDAHRLDPPASGEADARDRRYALLESSARAFGERAWVLTAHHRDDQAETVLFRAIRGTGLRGLRGIAPRRGRVLRPLLPVGRAEIRAYAAGNGLRWRDDPTNRDLGYARNRLRHEVIPALERVRPGAARALARLADRARATEHTLGRVIERLVSDATIEDGGAGVVLARGVLLSYHRDLRARVLRHVLRRYGSTPDRAGTHAALEFISSGPSGGELHVAGGVRMERDFDRIRLVPADARAGRDTDDAPLAVPDAGPGAGTASIGGNELDVRWRPAAGEPGGPGPRITVPGPDYPLMVRGWRPGDRIRFDYGSKKLTKLFAEKRMGREARRRTPLVVDAAGRVLWVVGVARAEGVGEDGAGLEITVADVGGEP